VNAATPREQERPPEPSASQFRHDLRNAIGQVIGYSEMLVEESVDTADMALRADLAKIRDAARHALTLVEANLDLDTFDRPSLSLPEPVAPSTVPGSRPSTLPVGDPAPGRVLVIDDNADNRDLLVRRLSGQGFRCVTATDGADGLRRLMAADFDVILLDIMMPGMDGYEVLGRIKADPARRHLPVLMISAVGETESVVRCIELGAADYLTKPFDPVLLRARVGACLHAKRLHDREVEQLRDVQENLRRERRITDALQLSLIRGLRPDAFPGLTVACRYEAAWSEAQVGGDLFDGFALPNGRIALAVADASGKGLAAAARVAQVKYVLRAYARESAGDPAAIASRVNDYLCDAGAAASPDGEDDAGAPGAFVTLSLAIVDPRTGEAVFACAGNDSPLILRAGSGGAASEGERVEAVDVRGLPLGILPGTAYENAACSLYPGDALLLHTDGLTEARCGTEFLGSDGLAEMVRGAILGRHGDDLASLATTLLEGARDFAGGTLGDDVCLLLARRNRDG
jgi:sigma-B regulation protein RsbU (phosphoserine phosphatase)